MGDERVGVALFVRVHDHAGRLVCEQDILVLVDDGEARRLDAAERLFLAHGFEVFVVDVELEQVALGELARGLGALAVELDALETQVLVHHAARKIRHGFFQKFIQALPAVVFCDIIFSQSKVPFLFLCVIQV